MKKLIIISLFSVSLSSCIKTYTCECKDSTGGSVGELKAVAGSKSKAIEKCEKDITTANATCTIK